LDKEGNVKKKPFESALSQIKDLESEMNKMAGHVKELQTAFSVTKTDDGKANQIYNQTLKSLNLMARLYQGYADAVKAGSLNEQVMVDNMKSLARVMNGDDFKSFENNWDKI